MRTVHADLDARVLETKRMQTLARDSLRVLLGNPAQGDGQFDVDDDPFERPEVTSHPVTYYEDLARATVPR